MVEIVKVMPVNGEDIEKEVQTWEQKKSKNSKVRFRFSKNDEFMECEFHSCA